MSQLAARLEKTEVQLETDLSKSATLPPGASLSAAMASDAGHKTHTLRRPKKEEIVLPIEEQLTSRSEGVKQVPAPSMQTVPVYVNVNDELQGSKSASRTASVGVSDSPMLHQETPTPELGQVAQSSDTKASRYVNVSDDYLATLRKPKPLLPAADAQQQTLRLTRPKDSSGLTKEEYIDIGQTPGDQAAKGSKFTRTPALDYLVIDDIVESSDEVASAFPHCVFSLLSFRQQLSI